ncbi:MAG: hypothetical protein [Bacteriophage sp.]|nr:MAG: hypothetical protein [Bacteriophage sp.]
MPSITAADVIDQTIYARNRVNGYTSDFKTVKKTFSPGALIGQVYSWVTSPNGDVYWMVYVDQDDYTNFNPTYIKHSASDLSLPALPDILQKISDQKDAADRQSKGLLQYNIDKYGKWIVGGIVVAVALPTIVRTLQHRKQSAVSGTNDKKALLLLLLIGGGVYLYAQSNKKKRKGSVEIGPLDQGEFGPDVAEADTTATIFYDATKFMAGNTRPSVPLII